MYIDSVKIIDIPEYRDHRGGLSIIENKLIPFKIKRVFYLYDVPEGSFRGKHAHIEHYTCLVAIRGSFDVTLIDTKGKQDMIQLNKPNKALLLPNMVWHELNNFSQGAVCLVLASDIHKEEDYIRDFDEFLNHQAKKY